MARTTTRESETKMAATASNFSPPSWYNNREKSKGALDDISA